MIQEPFTKLYSNQWCYVKISFKKRLKSVKDMDTVILVTYGNLRYKIYTSSRIWSAAGVSATTKLSQS